MSVDRVRSDISSGTLRVENEGRGQLVCREAVESQAGWLYSLRQGGLGSHSVLVFVYSQLLEICASAQVKCAAR